MPIFCPAFSDCSAGFGLVAIQASRGDAPKPTWDGGKDFYELTQLKIKNKETGLFMIGGGVPKNFTQDIVVAAEVLGHDAPMHKYAIQVTVADVRDGALSQLHAEGSQQLGQGRHGVRADGLQRGDAGRAADRRLRLPQGLVEGPHGQEVGPLAGTAGGGRGVTRARPSAD